VTLHAPSKTFNIAGLETSFAVIPDPEKKKLFDRQIRNASLSLGNIFGPIALEAAYTQGAAWLDELLVYLEGNLELLERFLAERVPRIRFIRPEGTYLALMDCRALEMEQSKLNEFFLKKARVYFNEGPLFGEELRGYVRINFGCPRALLEEALHRLERAVNSL
jgi:cystathionine beta-lyase